MLVGQLVAGLRSRDLDFHPIANEIGALDGSENSRSANTKPAKPFKRGRLKGLMHKHFFQSNNIARNVMDHCFNPSRSKAPKLDALIKTAMDDGQIPSEKKTDYVLHTSRIGGPEDCSYDN